MRLKKKTMYSQRFHVDWIHGPFLNGSFPLAPFVWVEVRLHVSDANYSKQTLLFLSNKHESFSITQCHLDIFYYVPIISELKILAYIILA